MAQSEIDLESFDEKPVWSVDRDRFPLKKRRNLLLGSVREARLKICAPISPSFDVGGTMDENKCRELGDSKNLYRGCVAEDQIINSISREGHAGEPGEHKGQESLDKKMVKVESADEPSSNITTGSFSDEIQTANFDTVTSDMFFDELDHLVLKERLKGLLMSKFQEFPSAVLKGNSPTYADRVGTQASTKIYSSVGRPFKYESVVKVEVSCSDAIENPISTLASELSGNRFMVKTEILDACCNDELDDMFLSLRMKLLQAKDGSKTSVKKTLDCDSKTFSSNRGFKPFASQPAQTLKTNRPRKKRKTATDSVEIAMEEDAPGLLQILVEKGVVVSEIKLYSEPESDDVIDDDSADNFGDLESVISQLFTRRESVLDVGKFRISKAEKPSYCLECLFSLVEQARYLQFRKWPVEWGWCRDLQSFIFVFERHKRIVLERPEYGYATYFFELPDSISIDWQIKRLVIVMKFTSCSRSSLLENKSLVVGDDLSEGEARVLMEYGWTPNTGLGAMVNYCDRVVHDRKNEKDRSEWRSKIGKLLVDGFNGGTLLNAAAIPVKAEEYDDFVNSSQVKLEPI